MKKILLLPLIAFLFIGAINAQGTGINFTSDNWETILVNAKKENKIIFIDAYTSWCGPCKLMAKKIFTESSVGDFYNQKFINVKMDMEKGDGVALAKRYNVILYPTLLFVDGTGKIIHRSTGYHTVPQFLELGQEASDPSKALGVLEASYASGEKGPDFLLNYAIARRKLMDGSHMPIAEEYMATQKDWTKPENMDLIFGMVESTTSPMFDHLIENKEAYIEVYGPENVDSKIDYLLNTALFTQGKEASLEEADALFKKVAPEKAPELSSRFRMTHYRQQGDRANYADAAIAHYKNFNAANWDELNEVGWTFYQVVDDKKKLKQAVKWVEQSIEMDSNFYNMDTLAALYYKLKKKRKAKKTATQAIALAKAAGEDSSETEALLAKIKSL